MVFAPVAAIAIVILFGHWLCRVSPSLARWVAWGVLAFGTFAMERLVAREPAGVRMLSLIAFVLVVMKVVVVSEERARGMPPLTFRAWLGFSCGWLGMQPRLFLSAAGKPLPGAGALVRRGITCAAAGAGLVLLGKVAFLGTRSRLLATALVLPGLSLLVHFGLCTLLAGVWRRRGVACDVLFRAPLRSESLGEFWARRWNLAFSEMLTIAVYRPLAQRRGRGVALLAAFALSGLFHELAISVPVRAGFGLPLAYFVVHGGLVLLERARSKAPLAISGWVGRSWALFWLVAPLPMLFHPPFLQGVVWPLIGIE